MPSALELAMGTTEKIRRVPGWWHVWRAAEALGAVPKQPVIFECVGVPGVIESIVDAAPVFSRVVVVGVCVGADRFTPALANTKELDLRFVFGYSPLEFRVIEPLPGFRRALVGDLHHRSRRVIVAGIRGEEADIGPPTRAVDARVGDRPEQQLRAILAQVVLALLLQ